MNRPKLVLLDLDSALLQGDQESCTHIAEAMHVIREVDIPVRLLTNDSLRSIEETVDSLKPLGIALGMDEVITAPQYMAAWLSKRTPRATVFLMGSDAARHCLEQAGSRVIDDPDEIGYLCDYIVTGAYPGWSYDALVHAYRCHTLDAKFVSIECEPVYHASSDPLPAGGVTAAALEGIFGTGPVFTAGMPNPGFLRYAAQQSGADPTETLLIGDARRNPIEAAKEAGMSLVLLGDAPAEIDSNGPVTQRLNGYAGLAPYLREILV